jgi:uncharacterized protein YcfJ
MIKHTLIATLLLTSSAYADTVQATIQDHYRTVTENVPRVTNRCENVQVPIYGQTQGDFNTGGAIIGGLVGGILGNQVGGGSGKDVATGVGAITGAIIGGGGNRSEQVITGYRTERQCSEVTTYNEVSRQVYSHSSITFTDNGSRVTLNYTK